MQGPDLFLAMERTQFKCRFPQLLRVSVFPLGELLIFFISVTCWDFIPQPGSRLTFPGRESSPGKLVKQFCENFIQLLNEYFNLLPSWKHNTSRNVRQCQFPIRRKVNPILHIAKLEFNSLHIIVIVVLLCVSINLVLPFYFLHFTLLKPHFVSNL